MGERRPNLRAVPNRTDSDTAKNLPVVGTNIVLVTPIPAAMIVAMVVVVVMVMVVVIVVVLVFVFVFVFVFVANLDQVGKIQRSERRGLRYRQGPGCRGGGEGQGGCRHRSLGYSGAHRTSCTFQTRLQLENPRKGSCLGAPRILSLMLATHGSGCRRLVPHHDFDKRRLFALTCVR
jgi:hypothetical protein